MIKLRKAWATRQSGTLTVKSTRMVWRTSGACSSAICAELTCLLSHSILTVTLMNKFSVSTTVPRKTIR